MKQTDFGFANRSPQDPDGNIVMSIAENRLTVDLIKDKLQCQHTFPGTVFFYDNMTGSDKFKAAMLALVHGTFMQASLVHCAVIPMCLEHIPSYAWRATRGQVLSWHGLFCSQLTAQNTCCGSVSIIVVQGLSLALLVTMQGLDLKPQNLTISSGCGAIINNLIYCLTEPGQGVAIPAPYYPAFDHDIRVRGNRV